MKWSRKRTTLLLLAASFFVIMFARLVVSPIVPQLLEEFVVTKGDMGFALTGLWFTYAVFQLPGGILANRYGERRIVVGGFGLLALSSLLVMVSPSFPAFVVGLLLLGAGPGLYFPAATSLLSEHFRTNRSRALGLHIAGGDAAGLVTPLVATYISYRFGWRLVFLVPFLLAIPITVAVLRYVDQPDDVREHNRPDGDRERTMTRTDLRQLPSLLRRPTILSSVFLAAALAFAFQSVTSFFPTFLIEHRSLTPEYANFLFSMTFLVWIVGLPVLGHVADRLSLDWILVVIVLSLATGLALLVFGPAGLMVGGVAFVGIGMSWGGIVGSRFMLGLSDDQRAAGYGMVRTLYLSIGALGNVVTGQLSTLFGWPVAYGALAAGMAGVGVVLLGSLGYRRL